MRKIDFLCFGDNDWWYHNHGHMDIQLMRRFAETGTVLYINSVIIRKFHVNEGRMFLRRVKRKLRSVMKGLRPTDVEGMFAYSPFTMPVHHIAGARELNLLVLRLQVQRKTRKLGMKKPVVWVACPGAAEAAIRLPHTKLVYQRTDRYEDFPGVDSEQIKRYDQLLKQHADLVVYVNRRLMALEQSECSNAIFLDHGVDYELFANARNEPYIPEEMKKIPHPILGFYGSIDDHTLDIALVEEVAGLLSDISIVLIGDSSIDLSSLASYQNVYLLGQKPYEQIPHYAKCFDVCFMPWRQNQWIEACNPIKLKEYLAMGKPVVSTPFSELEHYKGMVRIASDSRSFAEAVRKACVEDEPRLSSLRRKRVSNCTWDAKAIEVMHALYATN